MGANLITPAVAHIGTTLSHLYSHTEQRYYTKSKANARFLPGRDRPGRQDAQGHLHTAVEPQCLSPGEL
jgi:hypothetical protein